MIMRDAPEDAESWPAASSPKLGMSLCTKGFAAYFQIERPVTVTIVDVRESGIVLAGAFIDYYEARLFVPKGHFDEDHLLTGGKPEPHVLAAFQLFVHPGDVVVDIGANIGTHTFALASLVTKTGKVYAVEADVDNVTYLRLSIVTSGSENIYLLPVAAADKPGLIRAFCTFGTNSVFSAQAGASTVKIAGAVALDALIDEKVALIKLDVEGAELLALRGLTATIARSRPVILSEFSPTYIAQALGSDRSREFFDFFRNRDYDCFHVDPSLGLQHRVDYDALLASQRDAYERFKWNHIDTVFVPAERRATTPAQTAKRTYAVPAFLLRKPTHADVPWRFEEPSLETIVSQLCTAEQMTTPEYVRFCEKLGLPPSARQRKIWEFVYILAALERRGKLGPDKRGVGFGTGHEPLPSVFASTGTRIVATDAPQDLSASEAWARSNQWSKSLEDLWLPRCLSREDFLERVQFRAVDMNAIPTDLRDFDFCWSACCLEHLGSIRHGLDFIRNSMETLKSGGVAVHTTEFNLQSDTDTFEVPALCLFRKSDIELVIHELVQDGHHVEPLNLWPGATPVDEHIDLPPYTDIHLKLEVASYVTTSIGIIVTKR